MTKVHSLKRRQHSCPGNEQAIGITFALPSIYINGNQEMPNSTGCVLERTELDIIKGVTTEISQLTSTIECKLPRATYLVRTNSTSIWVEAKSAKEGVTLIMRNSGGFDKNLGEMSLKISPRTIKTLKR